MFKSYKFIIDNALEIRKKIQCYLMFKAWLFSKVLKLRGKVYNSIYNYRIKNMGSLCMKSPFNTAWVK